MSAQRKKSAHETFEDHVLSRLLAMPPDPHKAKPATKKKAAPKAKPKGGA